MVELTSKRIAEILSEETAKKEELPTILRGVYTRYMHLFEKYFADIDALNDDAIAKLKEYHEETKSFVKYYYMDIPQDICNNIEEFDTNYVDEMLGPKWHDVVSKSYHEFKKDNKDKKKSEEELKKAYKKEMSDSFYSSMSYIFREGFGTGSKKIENTLAGIANFLFGTKEEK